MIYLPNGCSCSTPSVFPKNWEKGGASLKVNWKIQFYFHDPAFKDKYPHGKYCPMKGNVNRYKSLQERRFVTKILLEEVTAALKGGFNPITGIVKPEVEVQVNENDISPSTPFIIALKIANENMEAGSTKNNIASALKRIEKASFDLKYQNIPISEIDRQHFRRILKECGNQKDANAKSLPWSACTFNHYRSYLKMLFAELDEDGIIEHDPISKIKKQKEEKKYKATLNIEQRKKIDEHFKTADPYYHRFIHIFFHSGARPSELLKIKSSDVDIERGTFKITIKKGSYIHEDIRPIKDIVKNYWIEALNECMHGEYLFGKKLMPGGQSCTRDYVTKIWQQVVKLKLKIDIDLYTLKHLNLDETAALLSLKDASAMAGHKSTIITMKHYAFGEKGREMERLKGIKNSFA